MKRKKEIILIVLLSVSFFQFANAQIGDSFTCEDYLRKLRYEERMTLWSRAPVLKANNAPLLCELCDIVSSDSCKVFSATIILDTIGKPMCILPYSKIRNDSLKNKIIQMLYQLDFEPALVYKSPVLSHYFVIINSKQCEFYKYMNRHKRRKDSK